MPDQSHQTGVHIEHTSQLIDWLRQHETAKPDWRIGTEHEKFLYNIDNFHALPYEGERSIGALLHYLKTHHDMTPIMEKEVLIGLKDGKGASLTLEPGGQFELSGAPLESLHETCTETGRHLKQMRDACSALGLGMFGMGFHPKWQRGDIHWMPKGRYRIMRDYMPTKGDLGLDMMLRTCTVQVNLDYADESDMVKKFRSSLALQPVATALFANSPFKNGQPSGWKSTRAFTWTDVDGDRCGVPACVFNDGFGYEEWIDYILDVPMYFLCRDGVYEDVAGLSFRDFMKGALPGYPGLLPTMSDFEDHITTAFPEVRLKGYLEMRGADSGSWENICALPALWVGLLYDEEVLDETVALTKSLSHSEVEAGRLSAARDGLAGQMAGRSLHDWARDIVDLASKGLRNRAFLDSAGSDETGFLQPLRQIVQSGETGADVLLKAYHGPWQGKVDPLFETMGYTDRS